MITIGAGIDTYLPWEAFLIGIWGSFCYIMVCWLFEKLELDDAVEGFQVHSGCGIAGILAHAFWNHEDGIFHGNPTNGKVLGNNLLGTLVIAAWSFSLSFIIWYALKKIRLLQITLKVELFGYDYIDVAQQFKQDEAIFREKK